MTTKRSRRWNGNLDSLSTDFLKDVLEKMESYGPNVQFAMPGHSQRPNYQVINKAGKKMGFDKKNLLMSLNSDGNISDTLSTAFTLDAVKIVMSGGGKAAPRPRASRSSTAGASPRSTSRASSTPVAEVIDTVEHDKYAYFKANRGDLPEGIQKHSGAISDLMHNGMSAEAAFHEIIKQHF